MNPFAKGAEGNKFGRILPAQGGSIFGGTSTSALTAQHQNPFQSKNNKIVEEEDDQDYEETSETEEFDPNDLFTDNQIAIDSLESYVSTVMEYLGFHDWTATTLIAPLLSLDHDHVLCNFLQVENPDIVLDINSSDEIYCEFVAAHISVCYYVAKEEWYKAYSMQMSMVTVFLKEIIQKSKDCNWFLPLLYPLCFDLRRLAKKAQATESNLDEDSTVDYNDDVANQFMNIYRSCVSDNRLTLKESKKVAIFPLTLLLMQSYFESNKMALLKPLIRAIDNLSVSFKARIPLSELVTYNFYLGKKAMFDSDLQTADKSLEYAFKYCPEKYLENKRRILIYWIPVKMFLGEIPLDSVLEDYNLNEFKIIAQGVRDGNIRYLRQGIISNRQFLMKSGVYLMFEKLAQLTYLALFKRLATIIGRPQIKIEMFMHLLKFLGEDIRHIDEVVCVLSNLIAKKKIKGYISKTHNTVVLSKLSPFYE
uniref:CSN12-like protein n=1 Tax=Panagrolaimus davidi TaxID=227884 RepID=A0A914PYU4_9BILA